MDKEVAQQKIAELVEKYVSQAETFEQADYNEARTRMDFINPLFKLLGWDMDNEKGLMQYLREVILEDRVSVDGRVKHPDYSFRLGNTTLFYVEAKKPSVNILEDKESAYQLRHYGWNTGLTMSLLTNFREFAVYDCRVKPDRKDKASVARLTYFTYQDLTEKQGVFGDLRDGFDFLWDTFTQENVSKGSFEKFIKDDGDRFKRGVVTVDQDFLLFLEDWRKKFAASIFRANKNLTEGELNFAVQHVLDRVVFLRFAESRGIEPHAQLEKAVKTQESGTCYKNLYELFELADDKYNSGLFDMQKDSISRNLIVDNKLLQQFVAGFYYPNPYDFHAMPVEILGSAYERFLGKTIRIISGRYATVEEKSEVRKSGGVYYTPQYVVDYIVEHTVGTMLEGKTPKEASKIKIVDPACGSGSFLLGAYQYLLDWHRNYYAEHSPPSKGSKTDPLMPDGHLSIDEKKRILANNIFGVDIDVNAVEFTKLSLLLRCMEGEHANVFQRLKIYGERLLPNIDGNIREGNSLIDTDFYNVFPDDDAESKIKPFHWHRAFPDAFKQGGFDVVLGNPPYVDYRHLDAHSVQYFKMRYDTAKVKEKWSLFLLFVERSGAILKKNGFYGMIIPNTLLSANFAMQTRKWLLTNKAISRIIDVSSIRVFGQTATYPILLFYQNSSPTSAHMIRSGIATSSDLSQLIEGEIDQSEITDNNEKYAVSLLSSREDIKVVRKLDEHKTKLKDLASIFHWGSSISNFRGYKIQERDYNRLSKKGKKEYEPVIQTADIKRFCIEWQREYIQRDIYSDKTVHHFGQTKVVIARLTKSMQATIDSKGYFMGKSSYIITDKIDYHYLVALLNCRLINFYYRHRFETTHLSGGYLRFDIPYLGEIPIRMINATDKADKKIFDNIVADVRKLIELYTERGDILLSSRKYQIDDKIAHFERRIDELVYQLYGLTDKEIAIIEEAP